MSDTPATVPLPLRLHPGQDLRRALEAAVAAQGCGAAFVVAGIGSLQPALIRLADAPQATPIEGSVEVLTLSGSVGADGSHLHASVSDTQGRVIGGHVAYGCIVHTTAEVLLQLLPGWRFTRAADAATGFLELQVQRLA